MVVTDKGVAHDFVNEIDAGAFFYYKGRLGDQKNARIARLERAAGQACT
jgi:hypothetical protein